MRLHHLNEIRGKVSTPWDFSEGGRVSLPGQSTLEGMDALARRPLPNGLVGVALAAPQVGIFKRFFVIAMPGQPARWVFNPVVTWVSPRKVSAVEGCLTVPGEKFVVLRHRALSLAGQHEDGRAFTWKRCDGLLARIIQHEIDHLDGICVKHFAPPVTVHRAGEAPAAV